VKDAGTFDRNRNPWQIRHVFPPMHRASVRWLNLSSLCGTN